MSVLSWGDQGKRLYETGVDQGVLYLWDDDASSQTPDPGWKLAYAWDGLISVQQSSEGGEPEPLYADNTKYIELVSNEDINLTIEAYTYPDAFAECDGSAEALTGMLVGQQTRKKFCFAYRTKVGNDEDGDAHGYKIHCVYNCLAAPSERSYETVNDSPEAINFSWEVSTTPVPMQNFKNTSVVTFDSTKMTASNWTKVTNKLYGTTTTDPEMLLPDDWITELS